MKRPTVAIEVLEVIRNLGGGRGMVSPLEAADVVTYISELERDRERPASILGTGDSLFIYRKSESEISVSYSRKGRTKKERPVKTVSNNLTSALNTINAARREQP